MSLIFRAAMSSFRVAPVPIFRAVAPILGNQAKRLIFSRKNESGKDFSRFNSGGGKTANTEIKDKNNDWKSISNEEWRSRLTSEEYEITRNKATELPFYGKYYNHNEEGVYHCTCCSNPLFSSRSKYDSGSGWPSFYATVEKNRDESGQVKLKTDTSFGMIRTEILCGKCDAHLGHLFNDGPPPTGLRYCINSIALKFQPKKDDNNGK